MKAIRARRQLDPRAVRAFWYAMALSAAGFTVSLLAFGGPIKAESIPWWGAVIFLVLSGIAWYFLIAYILLRLIRSSFKAKNPQ